MFRFLARIMALISFSFSVLHLIRIKQHWQLPTLWVPKIMAGALATITLPLGALAALIALFKRDGMSLSMGISAVVLSVRHIMRIVEPTNEKFDHVFGADWQSRIPDRLQAQMADDRLIVPMPLSTNYILRQNVVFWRVDDERDLLCNIWEPSANIRRSGLAFIYLHGSGWRGMHKDQGTRPMFQRLAAQGHVCMDVDYRLVPEVDIYGMMNDVNRAIAYMKQNAEKYQINPDRVVIAGGSAGAHLALLAAYTAGEPVFLPGDVNVDTSVRAVVSYYGPTDLRELNEDVQRLFTFPESMNDDIQSALVEIFQSRPIEKLPTNDDVKRNFFRDGIIYMLGGMRSEVPDVYELVSPIVHVDENCPPTLLFYGEHDLLVKAEDGHTLYNRLRAHNVPAIYIEYPATSHGFDLIMSRISAAAQSSLYDLERFLALML